MWIEFGWALFAAIGLLAVIGLPLVVAAGFRGYSAVALSPAAAVAVIAGTSVIAPIVGVPWSILPVLVLAAAGTIIVGILTRRFGRRERVPRSTWTWSAVVLAAALLTVQVLICFGAPNHISQTFDNIFHLNAIRWILDNGSASSFDVGAMTNPGAPGFYPAAWHALVSLVAQLSGADIPVAVSAVTVVISAVIWPMGAILLTRVIVGMRPAALIAAGILASAVPVFPILLMEYGVLYPYQLGLSLVPAALAVTAPALGAAVGREPARGWQYWLVLVPILGGIALAHPGAFVAWLAMSLPLFLACAVRIFAASSARTRIIVAVGVVAYLGAGLMLLKVLRPPLEARGWPITRTVPEALTQVMTGALWYATPAALVMVLVVAGVVTAFVRRSAAGFALLGTYAITALLFVVAGALPLQTIRDALVGSWYNNEPRLAAMVALAVVPLGALGACGIASLAARGIGGAQRSRAVVASLAALSIAGAVAWTQLGPLSPVPEAVAFTAKTYDERPNSALVSPRERALLERVQEIVPDDVAIAGSPWTGAAMAYALADREVLMPHALMQTTPDIDLVNERLREAEAGDEVCAAIDRLDVGYVLDFGKFEVHRGRHEYPGLEDLDTSDAVELVDSEGPSRLYKVVACEGAEQ